MTHSHHHVHSGFEGKTKPTVIAGGSYYEGAVEVGELPGGGQIVTAYS